MMGCDEACAAGFDLVFIGLPLLSLYEIPMLDNARDFAQIG